MVVKVFAIYDSKSEAYMSPFFLQTKGQAMRAFADSVADPKTQFHNHPGDFTLFEIGEYDDQKGWLKSHEAKINLGSALEFASKNLEHIAQTTTPLVKNMKSMKSVESKIQEQLA